jgi:aldehyde dehydrogenase (NAD+)
VAATAERELGFLVDGPSAPAFPGIRFGGSKRSGFGRGLETLDLHLETTTVLTYMGTRPANPFGL